MKIRIEQENFRLAIGKGYNDWVWLAHYASRMYSKNIYPQGVYIPAYLYLETKNVELHPHPRQRIKFFVQENQLTIEDITVVVKIRKANHIYTQYQRRWQSQAFGEDRYLSLHKFSYKVANINRKKDFYFLVKMTNKVYQEIKSHVNMKKYPNEIEVRLNQRKMNATDSSFEAQIKVPYGVSNFKLFYFQRDNANEDYRDYELLKQQKMKNDELKVSVQPKYVPKQQIIDLIQTDMRVSDNINQSLQQKQFQAKKRNANSSLSCFTFQQLWAAIQKHYGDQLFLKDYESTTKQRIGICLEKALDGLYQIFFYYFIIENQQKDKKEDLSTTYQHVLHFLRNYQIFPQTKELLAFFQFYNADKKFNKFQDTFDVVNCGVKFPQFIAILLRSVQFLQTSTFLLKGQTFDSAVDRILLKITQIQQQQEQFTNYLRNLRQNSHVITFVRNNSEQIKKIFMKQAQSSIQNSASEYCLKKQELKRMVQRANITQKSTDQVIQQCFQNLKLRQEGLYYYEFLQVLQWLALATITSNNEEQPQNQDQQAQVLVKKLKFLVQKLHVLT